MVDCLETRISKRTFTREHITLASSKTQDQILTVESLDDIESLKPQSKHYVVLYLYFVFGQFRQAVQILGCYYCLPITLYLQCICIIQTHSPNIGCSSCLPVSLFPLPLFLLMLLLHAAYKYFLIQLEILHTPPLLLLAAGAAACCLQMLSSESW